MSGNELTMDEKYFDLQNKLIETKLSSIASTLENFGKDVKKVLDDHEQRLREQAKISTTNAQEIITLNTINAQELVVLKNELKETKACVTNLEIELARRLDELANERKETVKKELTFWQTLAMDAVKYIAVGAGGGGAVVAILKIFGINV